MRSAPRSVGRASFLHVVHLLNVVDPVDRIVYFLPTWWKLCKKTNKEIKINSENGRGRGWGRRDCRATEVKAQRRPASCVCLSVRPLGEKWLNGFTGRVSQTQPLLQLPMTFSPCVRLKRGARPPRWPGGDRWMDQATEWRRQVRERDGQKQRARSEAGRKEGERWEGLMQLRKELKKKKKLWREEVK